MPKTEIKEGKIDHNRGKDRKDVITVEITTHTQDQTQTISLILFLKR